MNIKISESFSLHLSSRCNIFSFFASFIILILNTKQYKKVFDTDVYLLDFFCSRIQFYILLSPYLCFISFLYLDLYVLGNDAWIRKESFMPTKQLSTTELRVRPQGGV